MKNEETQKRPLGPLDPELKRVMEEDTRVEEFADDVIDSLGTMVRRPKKRREHTEKLTDVNF